MKNQIPKILLYSRLVFALVILALLFLDYPWEKYLVLTLLYTGIIADIFDGIIARRLNISTEQLRLHDTIIDLFFYFSVLIFLFFKDQYFFYDNIFLVCFILLLEIVMYATSLLRFGKLPSPHAVLSKFWGLYLVIEFTLLLLGINGIHFSIALCFGLLAHADRALIYLLIPKWEHDIPSSRHAFLLRQGKTISRNKLFNG